MKTAYQALLAAFSMFSAIPVPKSEWNDRSTRYVMAAFPFVGAAVGTGIVVWHFLSAALGFGFILSAAGLVILPVALTGGIHLDGFCDTVDALAGNTTPLRRLEILKDPHAGAFAVIWLSCYLLGSFALCTEIAGNFWAVVCMAMGFVLSRILSALSVLRFDCARKNGLAKTFSETSAKNRTQHILMGMLLFTAACIVMTARAAGVMMLIAAGGTFWMHHHVSEKYFGGITGDLAGWFLQICEIATTAALVFAKALGVGGVLFG